MTELHKIRIANKLQYEKISKFETQKTITIPKNDIFSKTYFSIELIKTLIKFILLP